MANVSAKITIFRIRWILTARNVIILVSYASPILKHVQVVKVNLREN
jgi:hypothetical protein